MKLYVIGVKNSFDIDTAKTAADKLNLSFEVIEVSEDDRQEKRNLYRKIF